MLYDRNLMLIFGERVVTNAPTVQEPEFLRIYGKQIKFAVKQSDWPDPQRLDCRTEIVRA